jgi:NOL1/NOP2/sun family putative RNA methylase
MKELGVDISLYQCYPRKSLHVLRNEKEIVNTFDLKPVKWAKHCFWADNPKKIQDMYYDSVFIQDPASVAPVLALDVDAGDHAVDLCAAPGGKLLHIAQAAEHVTAVDSHRQRVKRLLHTVRRFGVKNCVVLCKDGRNLRLDSQVDRVLVDAPCSGEGMVKKSHKTMALWSLKRIKVLSRIQKRLVLNGLSLVKRGGILVYATCTFAPEENEGVVEYVLTRRDVELEQISINHFHSIPGLAGWKGKEYAGDMKKTIRVYPYHNSTNGFFIAKFVKQ